MTDQEIKGFLSKENGYEWLQKNIDIFEPALYPTKALFRLADANRVSSVRFHAKKGETKRKENENGLARWICDELNKSQFRYPTSKNPSGEFKIDTVRDWVTSKNPKAKDFPKEHFVKLLIILSVNIADAEKYLAEAYPESGQTVFNFKDAEYLVYYYCIYNGKNIDAAFALIKKAHEILSDPECIKQIKNARVEIDGERIREEFTKFTIDIHAKTKKKKLSHDAELIEFIKEKAYYFHKFNNGAFDFLQKEFVYRGISDPDTFFIEKLSRIYGDKKEADDLFYDNIYSQNEPIGRRLFIEVLLAIGYDSSGDIDEPCLDKILLEGKINTEILEDAIVYLACAQTMHKHKKTAFDNYIQYRNEFLFGDKAD